LECGTRDHLSPPKRTTSLFDARCSSKSIALQSVATDVASTVACGGSTLSANRSTAIDGDLCSFTAPLLGFRCHYGGHRQRMIAAAG